MASVVALTLLLACGQFLPAANFFASPADYLPVHSALEFVSMAVSAMVFGLAWNLRHQPDNSRLMVIGSGFLAITLIDFAHTFSYAGMPDLITPSGPEKAINFWLAARGVGVIVLFALVLRPDSRWSMAACYRALLGALALAIGVWWVCIAHADWLPRTFVEGKGLTPFKVGAEYILGALYGMAAILLYRRGRRTANDDLQWLAAAAWVQGLAEMFFTLYAHVTDLFNLLGHVYKVIAYLMVYRALFVSAVQKPYHELEARVSQRTAELSATLRQLRDTQQELIETAKLASLGTLVAGVAHELNTPIGNALSVTSTLESRIEEMKALAASGELRRATLNQFFEDSSTIIEVLMRSSTRAANLITSFKQIAVDSTSEQRTHFNLLTVMQHVEASLRSDLPHRAAWSLVLDVPADIECDSYPVPLAQILTNLIENADLHAFEERAGGTLRIAASARDGEIMIEVADDGRGMDPATLARIFEPFYTTRFGRGGSGLGLAICRNIAIGMLGGALRCESSPGRGAVFSLTFPATAPTRPPVKNLGRRSSDRQTAASG